MKSFLWSLICLTLICSSMLVHAQDTNYVDPNYQGPKEKKQKTKTPFIKRTYLGGTLGISFGTYTSILVEPMVGFKLTPKLSTGIGIGYRYGKNNNTGFEYHNYIGRVFGRYLIIKRVYAHVEYMVESYDNGVFSSSDNSRTAVPFLFVGGGLRTPGARGSFIFQVLFNVLQDNEYSSLVYPSGQPYISLGYIGGF